MISVAMTACNAGHYLLDQLESLKKQTLQPDEVVIVDDASADGTPARIEAFIREHNLTHWRLQRNEKNLGYIQTFRQAIANTEGDWVFLCDHDDVWHPDKLQTMMEQAAAKPNAAALFHSFSRIDASGEPLPDLSTAGRPNQKLIRRPLASPKGDWIEWKDLAAYNVCQGCTLMISRQLADQYLAAAGLAHLPHDYALNILAALQSGLYFVNQPLIDYRIHESNTLGLTRTSQLEKRRADASVQAKAKQEALRIVRVYGNEAQKDLALKAANLFESRSEALAAKNPWKLLSLLPSASPFPTMKTTLAYDAKLCLQKGFGA